MSLEQGEWTAYNHQAGTGTGPVSNQGSQDTTGLQEVQTTYTHPTVSGARTHTHTPPASIWPWQLLLFKENPDPEKRPGTVGTAVSGNLEHQDLHADLRLPFIYMLCNLKQFLLWAQFLICKMWMGLTATTFPRLCED